MKKRIIMGVLAAVGVSAQAALITDDFDRPLTAFQTNELTQIGSGYWMTEGVQGTPTRHGAARILDNQIQFYFLGTATVNPSEFVMRQTGIELANSAVGESFEVSGDIQTYNAAVSTLFYGLAFNYQPDGSFYAARLNTGSAANVLQFIRVDAAGNASAFGQVGNSTALALDSIYNLTIQSSSAGVFNYTLTGAGLDNGGVLAGTETDVAWKLTNGTAGFYQNAINSTPKYDNLSINVIPEPGTLGMIALSGLGLVFVRRRLSI